MTGLSFVHFPVYAASITMGLRVRIEIEDNIWWDNERSKNVRTLI